MGSAGKLWNTALLFSHPGFRHAPGTWLSLAYPEPSCPEAPPMNSTCLLHLAPRLPHLCPFRCRSESAPGWSNQLPPKQRQMPSQASARKGKYRMICMQLCVCQKSGPWCALSCDWHKFSMRSQQFTNQNMHAWKIEFLALSPKPSQFSPEL